MNVKCVVACTNANGSPDFFPCEVIISKNGYDLGEHYDLAKEKAIAEHYEGVMIVFEPADGPKFLFDHFFPKVKKSN